MCTFLPPGGAPRGEPPREAQKCTQNGPILGGFQTRILLERALKRPHFGPILGAFSGVPGGRPGAPGGARGAPGPGPEFPPGAPRRESGLSGPGGVPEGGPGGGHFSPYPEPSLGPIITDPIGDALRMLSLAIAQCIDASPQA